MVTQAQIAKQLGVSRQLVTFALSGHPHVAEESRKMILAAAKELGYRPNPFARALKRKRTGILALWIPDQISTHYAHVSRELGRLVKQAGQELVISETSGADMSQVWSHLPVDGIFAVDASETSRRELESLSARAVPIVGIGTCGSDATDNVRVDLGPGTAAAMRHLLDSGCRRIAHATFVTENAPQESRRSEYVRAMRAAGLEPEFIQYPLSEDQRPIVRRLIREYVAAHGVPEAIFCHSDDVSIGIYRGLCDLGIRVPDQVALVGCDGIEDTEYLEVPITTLVQPVPEMCADAWGFLRSRLGDSTLPKRQAIHLPKLAIRASSARRP